MAARTGEPPEAQPPRLITALAMTVLRISMDSWVAESPQDQEDSTTAQAERVMTLLRTVLGPWPPRGLSSVRPASPLHHGLPSVLEHVMTASSPTARTEQPDSSALPQRFGTLFAGLMATMLLASLDRTIVH
ncbi:hypothetical protein LJ657_37885 [Streptomyces sp. NR30]|uniref:MftR C-terminal domain-containing protein n=1 Tax=Streptomyces guryensis TaxID=2886947 RepID=A0A9Q3VWY0_9ACTN|nr:hypothetical protein [Streptomyces guryensis]